MDIGYSFSPTNQSAQQGQQGGANNRLQDAIRILSFKVPTLNAAVSPTGAGLNTPTPQGAGLSPALIQNYLASLFGTLGVPSPAQGSYQSFIGQQPRALPSPAPQPFSQPTQPFRPQPQSYAPQPAQQSNAPLPASFNYRQPRPPAPTDLPSPEQPPQDQFTEPTPQRAQFPAMDNFGPFGGLARFGGFGRLG